MKQGHTRYRPSGRQLALAVMLSLGGSGAFAQEEHGGAGDLAKAAQNPIADLISLPFQNNFNFNVGPHNQLQDILNIQPVIPIHLDQDWNLITRWITPVISQPPLTITGDREFGLGDINPSFFFSPKQPTHGLIWGIGPTFVFPSGTDKTLTQGKYSIGPSFVAVVNEGPWLFGVLINNVWSFAGRSNRPDVNQMLVQPFVNYNFPGGWYLTSSPIVTANWEADHGERWTVPVGGGFGRVFRIDKQPVNAQLSAYYNVVKPTDGADWQLRAQLTFLFPEKAQPAVAHRR
ncbi:hypothetical protein [Microvirga calopogonii]|uniref:hypothetical protein n=1 Tax=Microvirga calopogonii TaxID=2078013 RepID=UPI00197CAAC0|nr:hypothetical protein [Microvirga calopogonii]